MVILMMIIWSIFSIVLFITIDDINHSIAVSIFLATLFVIIYFLYNNYIRYLKVNKHSKCYKYMKHFKEVGCLDENCLYTIKEYGRNIYIVKELEDGYYKIFIGVGCNNYHNFIAYLDEEKYGKLKPMTRVSILYIKDGCCAVIKPRERRR